MPPGRGALARCSDLPCYDASRRSGVWGAGRLAWAGLVKKTTRIAPCRPPPRMIEFARITGPVSVSDVSGLVDSATLARGVLAGLAGISAGGSVIGFIALRMIEVLSLSSRYVARIEAVVQSSAICVAWRKSLAYAHGFPFDAGKACHVTTCIEPPGFAACFANSKRRLIPTPI